MRRLAGLLLLACAGCLEYEIDVTTEVAPDGSFRRTVKIREKDDSHTWRRFKPAAAPYALEGSDAKGFVATASFKRGRHASGIRAVDHNVEGDYGGADDVKDLPAVEGTVAIEVSDLGIGKLYTYRERLEVGADPVAFRRAIRRWLDFSLEILMETLRHKMPDVDFEPVERNARRVMIPKLEAAVRTAHLALGALMLDFRTHRYGRLAAPWLANPHVKILLDVAGGLGFARLEDAPVPEFVDQFFSPDAWDIGPDLRILNDFLAPLEQLPLQRREEIKAYLLGGAEDDFEEALERLHPIEEEREKIGQAARATAVDGLGVYTTYGIVDSFRFRHRVKLPGDVLRTNGDIGERGVVTWSLLGPAIMLVSPELTAYSFVTTEGVRPRRWKAAALILLRDEMAELDSGARATLTDLAREADKADWDLDKVLAQDPEEEPYRDTLEKLKQAVDAAK